MDSREENIVAAAIRVIMRYGVRRATMNDIATEAGVARQTLYNIYPNKEEVIRATVRLFVDRAVNAIEEETATVESLADKLDIVFEHLTIRYYDLLHTSPEADDIISGFDEAARDEIAVGNERCRSAVEGVLSPYEKSMETAGMELAELSDYVRQSLSAIKYDATDRKHLMRLLKSLKTLILTVVDEK